MNKLTQRRYHSFDVKDIGTITIRNISERERAEMMKGIDVEQDFDLLRRRMVALTLVSVDNDPLTLTEDDVADVDFGTVNRIVEEAQKFCGIGGSEGN